MQRSMPVLGGSVRRCTFVEQQQRHRLVVVVGSDVQRRHTVLSTGVRFRIPLQQETGDVQVAVLGREVKRGETLLGGGGEVGTVVQEDGGNLDNVYVNDNECTIKLRLCSFKRLLGISDVVYVIAERCLL